MSSDPGTFTEPPADVLDHLFPWVEAELDALQVRVSQKLSNKDIALREFLGLMQWLRVVLVQDCALLYAKYPHCPIFNFAPFTFSSFTTFSAHAANLVAAAEEKARLAFHNLPDHMARSMRGYAADLQMKQELSLRQLSEQMQEMREENAQLKQLVIASSSKGSRRKTPSEFLDPDKTALQAD